MPARSTFALIPRRLSSRPAAEFTSFSACTPNRRENFPQPVCGIAVTSITAWLMPPQPGLVNADPAQLGRVLDNLMNNAMTYNLSSARVAVTVSTSDDQASVRVADNGVGIPAQERERIFEQFHRINEPSFINVPGTGLGLYISRHLAEANGGRLTLESSSPQEGAVFLLTLPAEPTPAEVTAADHALASMTPVRRRAATPGR